MRRLIWIGALLGVAALLCGAFWAGRQTSKRTHHLAFAAATAAPEQDPPPPMARPPAVALTPASVAVTGARTQRLPDEASVMSTLRALGDSAPERSLRLAKEAEQRFPGSADAPERAWYICKSLVNLERFYDAREQARLMVNEYPDTPWSVDVARHLLVNPLDLPGDPAP